MTEYEAKLFCMTQEILAGMGLLLIKCVALKMETDPIRTAKFPPARKSRVQTCSRLYAEFKTMGWFVLMENLYYTACNLPAPLKSIPYQLPAHRMLEIDDLNKCIRWEKTGVRLICRYGSNLIGRVSFRRHSDGHSALQAILARYIIGIKDLDPDNMLVIRTPVIVPTQIYHIGCHHICDSATDKVLARRMFAGKPGYAVTLKNLWDRCKVKTPSTLASWKVYFQSNEFDNLISCDRYRVIFQLQTTETFRKQILERATFTISTPVKFANRELVIDPREDAFLSEDADILFRKFRMAGQKKRTQKKRKRESQHTTAAASNGTPSEEEEEEEEEEPSAKRVAIQQDQQYSEPTGIRILSQELVAPIYVDLNEDLPPLPIEELFA